MLKGVIGTGSNNPDYDNDGLLDGEEYYGWLDLKDVFIYGFKGFKIQMMMELTIGMKAEKIT